MTGKAKSAARNIAIIVKTKPSSPAIIATIKMSPSPTTSLLLMTKNELLISQNKDAKIPIESKLK